ncbi:ribosome biogenesis GTP-binding protein YihA/YsxC [Helicobacter heilmannii]|uniref:Probable GTP-binding protein EngB n=1 Tax=Helicobacter heilmannii TaxID=35817 RepID=A0A0K2XMN3_HELHE|nr:ribosome biogenesis GTP-binding protein YihA/YsxC [Helicobacter heilmannii]CCM10768.1 GTP-binding protein EngB [Helicobacter heilmannii ASB1.4]CRF46035.1 GTP-binding protein EngB [Helicobacter heilmannii]CRF47713.1 GTP-binding protein EngB [Helicobacter heilmannii]CRF48831.1 GTP-binding protein EngB [Helicobacter heilmannii]CRF51300.1 GTP-binding protein EngB [Helicobacter heilmannii]
MPKNSPSLKVLESHFVCSAINMAQTPPAHLPEVAFLGRSNVGKSSFINQLLGRKIAKSSATPGKTQMANFFTTTWQLGEEKIAFGCIDLPGFGYAKVSKSLQEEWGVFLCTLLKQRPNIKVFLHLIDARHPHLSQDARVQEFLKSFIKPDQCIRCIYTKFDKLTSHAKHALLQEHPQALVSVLKPSTLKPKFGSLEQLQATLLNALLGYACA